MNAKTLASALLALAAAALLAAWLLPAQEEGGEWNFEGCEPGRAVVHYQATESEETPSVSYASNLTADVSVNFPFCDKQAFELHAQGFQVPPTLIHVPFIAYPANVPVPVEANGTASYRITDIHRSAGQYCRETETSITQGSLTFGRPSDAELGFFVDLDKNTVVSFSFSGPGIPVTATQDRKCSGTHCPEGCNYSAPPVSSVWPFGFSFANPYGVVPGEQWSGGGSPSGYSGSVTRSTQQGDRTLKESVSFQLDLRPSLYEVVITPPDTLRDWLPEGGETEDAAGSTLRFTGEIRLRQATAAATPHKAKVEFALESSKEPGICVNFPPKTSAGKRPDLRILKEGTSGAFKIKEEAGSENEPARYTAEGEFNPGESFTLVVGSFDYGAYGTLSVSGSEPVRIEGYPDKTSLDLPRDENGNHVADAWEEEQLLKEAEVSTDEASDEDFHPAGDGDAGDGLSLYEEYRGFRVRGRHIRTQPTTKDLFIHDLDKLGVGAFGQSRLQVHLVRQDEFAIEQGAKNPYIINFNHGFAHQVDQHILWLQDGELPGLLGYAFCDLTKKWHAKNCYPVMVNAAACKKSGGVQQLQSIIAHELAHAVTVYHHGEEDYKVPETDVEMRNPGGGWDRLTLPPSTRDYTIAARGGQESGVQDCIMRYAGTSFYEAPGGQYRWVKPGGGGRLEGEWYPPLEAPGTIFCDKKEGTGVNDPTGGALPGGRKRPKAGDATRGECRQQLCVNDMKH